MVRAVEVRWSGVARDDTVVRAVEVRGPVTGRAFVLGGKTADSLRRAALAQGRLPHILTATRLRMARNDKVVRVGKLRARSLGPLVRTRTFGMTKGEVGPDER